MRKLILQYFLVGIIIFFWSSIYAFLSFMGKDHWSVLVLLLITSVSTAHFTIAICQKRKIFPLVSNVVNGAQVNNVTLDSENEEKLQYTELLETEIKEAKDSIIIVSDNLNTKLYCNKRVMKAMDSKIKEGVKVYILCGQYIVTSDGHEFIEHFISENQFKGRVAFYCRLNRPPALHYKIIDKKRLIIEAIHSFGILERDVLIVEDKHIVQLFLNKFSICIKSNTCRRVPNISGYKFVSQFPLRYRANYENTLHKLKLNEAEVNSLNWLRGCFEKEFFNQIQLGENLAFI